MQIQRTDATFPIAPVQNPSASSRSYTVQSGDSLWSIAQQQLGKGEAWPELYAHNREQIGPDPNRLQPGTVLNLNTPAAPASPPVQPPSDNKHYTVKAGDSLWKIAARELGNGADWPELYALNQGTLGSSPDHLQPGMVLQLRPTAAPSTTDQVVSPPPSEGSATPHISLIDDTPSLPAETTVPASEAPQPIVPQEAQTATAPLTEKAVTEETVPTATPAATETPEAIAPQANEEVTAPLIETATPEETATPPTPLTAPETTPQVIETAPAMPTAPVADTPPVTETPEAMAPQVNEEVTAPLTETAAPEETATPPTPLTAPESTPSETPPQVMATAPAMPTAPVADAAPVTPVSTSEPIPTVPKPSAPPAAATVPVSEQPPQVDSTAPVAPSPVTQSEGVSLPANAATEAPIAPVTPAAPTAPLVENAPEVGLSPQAALQEQIGSLLSRIDGRGYTAAHHGDPVGGIPQVAKAMSELLALANRDPQPVIADADLQARFNHWTQEIASAHFQRATRNWDGFSEGSATQLQQQLTSPAFQQLPKARQQALLTPLMSTYQLAQQSPKAGPNTQQLVATLQPLLEPERSQLATASAAYQSLDQLLHTPASRWGSLTHQAKEQQVSELAEKIWQAFPQERGAVSLSLAKNDYPALSAELMARDLTQAATWVQQPNFPLKPVLEALNDQALGELLIALAREGTPEAQAVVSESLAQADAFFWFNDRKKPFEQLVAAPPFGQLAPELQSRIRSFIE